MFRMMASKADSETTKQVKHGGAAISTTSKNTVAVFLAKSVKKLVCFCQFQFEVYNWQYFILHWQNYTYYTVIFTVHCHFHTYEI